MSAPVPAAHGLANRFAYELIEPVRPRTRVGAVGRGVITRSAGSDRGVRRALLPRTERLRGKASRPGSKALLRSPPRPTTPAETHQDGGRPAGQRST